VNSALEERTYVVVGAGRGIGRLLAGDLAARGADLVLAARSRDELELAAQEITTAHGSTVHVMPTDVADHESVAALADFARERGPVTGLVNCAAILGPVGRLDEVDATAWRRAVTIDLFGTASCCAAFAPVLAAAGGGSIVNFSGGGIGGPGLPERISAYAAAKAGVVVLTEVLGREFAALGVRVNVVAPGPVPTGFMAEVLAGGTEAAGSELYDRTAAQHAEPEPTEALVDLVTFLLSPAAAAITGRFISAKWDPVTSLRAWAAGDVNPSRYTLRRIDGALFAEAGDGAAE
jgi:NAD(P)-dependent dehydrogenase (short-subunit alcohol dehydrogenase family)